MESEYIFKVKNLDEVDRFPADLLFLSKRFLEIQTSVENINFSINFKGKVFLTCTFSILENLAVSPHRAPLGGLNEIERLSSSMIESFIAFVEDELKSRGVKSISVSFPPNCYSPRTNIHVNAFLKRGWEVNHADIGLFLKLIEDQGYWKGLDAGSRNRLNKARKHGFYAEKLNQESLGRAYEIVVSNRLQNNYPITMSLENLQFMLENFEEYELFGVFDKGNMISMAICIQVSNTCAYLFYLADLHKYRSYSPNILLLNYIYDHYLNLDFELLDLGVVSEASSINKGLYTFKKNLGGIPTKKYTLQQHLS